MSDASGAGPDTPPERPTGKLTKAWWLEHWWLPLILVVIAGLFAIYASTRGDDQASVSASAGPSSRPRPAEIKNVADEAAARPSLWTGSVAKYKAPPFNGVSVEDLGSPDFDAYGDGDVQVYTPRKLWEEASDLDGETVVIAGRFVEGQSQRSQFGVDGVIRIRGREAGFDTYVGTSVYVGGYRSGEPGWALARIVASGETRPTAGGRWRSTYVVTGAIHDFKTSSEPGSAAIRKALNDVQPR